MANLNRDTTKTCPQPTLPLLAGKLKSAHPHSFDKLRTGQAFPGGIISDLHSFIVLSRMASCFIRGRQRGEACGLSPSPAGGGIRVGEHLWYSRNGFNPRKSRMNPKNHSSHRCHRHVTATQPFAGDGAHGHFRTKTVSPRWGMADQR